MGLTLTTTQMFVSTSWLLLSWFDTLNGEALDKGLSEACIEDGSSLVGGLIADVCLSNFEVMVFWLGCLLGMDSI